MATHEKTGELRKSESKIFNAWLLKMRDTGYLCNASLDRKYFTLIFGKVMDAMEADDQGPLFRPYGSAREWVFPRGENGITLEVFLASLKLMICCLEHTLSNLNIAPESRAAVAFQLRMIMDNAELSAVSEWETSVIDGYGRRFGGLQRPMALATPEKFLYAIFVSVGEGILLVDEDMEIVKANQRASEIFGLLERNLIGADIRALTDGPGARTLAGFFDELIEGQRMSAEITGMYVDGKTFPATVTVTRSDLDGKRYWPIIVQDDTNQKILERQLRQEKQQTEEMNLTLKTVLKSIEQDRKDLENRVASKIRTSLLPCVKKIEKAPDDNARKSYLGLLEQQLLSLTAGFERELDGNLLKLTRTEIEVCRLIQAGCSSKDICEALKLSFDTIQTHRKNIRKKLGLNGKKLNLHAHLINRIL